jgi:hypothetical protein
MTLDEFMALSRGNKGGDQRKFAYFFSNLDALPPSVQADVGDRCALPSSPPPAAANASLFVFIVVLRSFLAGGSHRSFLTVGWRLVWETNVWVGGPLIRTPTHYDLLHNFYVQVQGPPACAVCVCGGACACASGGGRRAQEVPAVLARAVAVPLPVPPVAPLDPHVAGGPGRAGAPVRRQRLRRVPR